MRVVVSNGARKCAGQGGTPTATSSVAPRLPERIGGERGQLRRHPRSATHVARAKIDKGVHLGYESWNTVQSSSKVSRLVLPAPHEAEGSATERAEARVRADPLDPGKAAETAELGPKAKLAKALTSFGRVENSRYFTQRHGTPTIR